MFDKLPELFDLSLRTVPEHIAQRDTTVGGATNWQLTFPNGCTLSVLWDPTGRGAYSSDHTVELWAWRGSHDGALWDDVRGWQTFSELLDAMREVSSLPHEASSATREITEG
jgi:hypothetical protein